MEQAKQAYQRGQKVRKLQDEVSALFIQNIQQMDDVTTLENIKEELKDGRL